MVDKVFEKPTGKGKVKYTGAKPKGYKSGWEFVADVKKKTKEVGKKLGKKIGKAASEYDYKKRKYQTPADKIKNYDKKRKKELKKVKTPNVKVEKNIRTRGVRKTQTRKYHNNTYKEGE